MGVDITYKKPKGFKDKFNKKLSKGEFERLENIVNNLEIWKK